MDDEAIKKEAYRVMNKYPEKVIIERCCVHNNPPMARHHYDYGKPLNVWLMCRKCHGGEHHSPKIKKRIPKDLVIAKFFSILNRKTDEFFTEVKK